MTVPARNVWLTFRDYFRRCLEKAFDTTSLGTWKVGRYIHHLFSAFIKSELV